MSRNTIIALVVVTILALGAAWMVTSSPSGADLGLPERLVPDLRSRVNEIASVRIKQGEEEIQLALKSGEWTLVSKDGYPAKFEPVKQLVLAVSELKPLEAKTSNPSQYERIEVGNPDEGGAGLLVEFDDALGKPVASVVLGKTRSAASFGAEPARFARNVDEARSWLVEGRVDARLDAMTWIEREIVAIPADRIRSVRVERAEGEAVSIVKSGEVWTLGSAPEGRTPKGPSDMRRVANAISFCGLADVRAGEIPDETPQRVDTTFTTTNDLAITVTTWMEGEEYWAVFAAEHTAPAPGATPSEESGEGSAAEEGGEGASEPDQPEEPGQSPAEELASLTERFSGWVFKLDSFKAEAIRPTMESLTQAVEAPDPGPAGPFPDVEAPAQDPPGFTPPPGG